MAIIRAERRRSFTTVSNEVIGDERLGCDALGVLVYLLSKPDHWTAQPGELRKRFGFGKDKAYKILNELIEAGYAKRVEGRDEMGRVTGTDYLISEQAASGYSDPVPEKPHAENTDLSKDGDLVNTVPNGTGASAPKTITKLIWEEGVQLLTEHSFGKPVNRSLVGRWCSQAKDDPEKLLNIIRTARENGTQDPIAYISAALDKQFGKPPDPKKFSAEDWSHRLTVAVKKRQWSKTWGPPPGAKGCMVPPDLVTPDVVALFKPEGAML